VALGLQKSGYTNIKVLEGPFAFDKWMAAGGPTEP
jgi:hypothetical protein